MQDDFPEFTNQMGFMSAPLSAKNQSDPQWMYSFSQQVQTESHLRNKTVS